MEIKKPYPDSLRTSQIVNESHKAHIEEQLGNFGVLLEKQNETTTGIDYQAGCLANYFTKASNELGNDATEDQIWERIFELQLKDLFELNLPGSKDYIHFEQIAVNLQIGILLSCYGLEKTAKQDFLTNKAWQIAQSGMGIDIIQSSVRNTGICVASDDPEKPFVSIVEQCETLDPLCTVLLDSKYDYSRDIEILSTSSPEQQLYFVDQMIKLGKLETLARNLHRIADHKQILEKLGNTGDMLAKEIIKIFETTPPYESKFYSPLLALFSAEQQSNIFNEILVKNSSALQSAVGDEYYPGFDSLGADELDKLLEAGYFDNNYNANLLAFTNLPPGYLEKLKNSGITLEALCSRISIFPESEIIQFYDEQIQKMEDDALVDSSIIFKYPDQFSGIELSRMLNDALKQPNGLKTILENFPKYSEIIDQQSIFEKFIENDSTLYSLEYKLNFFDQIDKDLVLDLLIQKEQYETIAKNLDYFGIDRIETIANALCKTPEGIKSLANNLEKFSEIDHNWLLSVLVDSEDFENIGKNAGKFIEKGADLEELFTKISNSPDALIELIKNYNNLKFIELIGKDRVYSKIFELCTDIQLANSILAIDKDYQDTALNIVIDNNSNEAIKVMLIWADERLKKQIIIKCCAAGNETPFCGDENSFSVFSESELTQMGAYATLLNNPSNFPNTNPDESFSLLIERGSYTDIKTVLYKMHAQKRNAPIWLAEKIVDSSIADIILNAKEAFLPESITEQIINKIISRVDRPFYDLYKYSGQKIEWLEQLFNSLGEDVSPMVALAFKEISRESAEPLPKEILDLGISERGIQGREKLKNIYGFIRDSMVNDSDNPEQLITLITTNPIAKSIAQQLVRFEDSTFGSHDEDSWNKILKKHLELSETTRSLSPGFIESQPYTVHSIDSTEFDASKIDEDAANKFKDLQKSIEIAISISEMPARERFTALFSEARNLVVSERNKLSVMLLELTKMGKDIAVDRTTKQINLIDKVLSMDLKEFMMLAKDDFQQLSLLNIKGLDAIIRAGVFAKAIKRSENAKEAALDLQGSEPSVENISKLNNFIEQIVNNEVYGNYFKSDTARKSFIRFLDTKALKQQISKAQSGKASGQTTLTFVPTRGILLELSGHLGDACWASTYESISEEFPNISAVTFVRNQGQRTERLVGSCLIIETVDQKTGEEVLVLRGINPIENYINAVKVNEFYSALVDYAHSIANGRKIAITMSTSAGHASTNRPTLFEYLEQTVHINSEPISLPDDTTFNGYRLSPETENPVYAI